jgi:cell division protein FtsQ
MIPEEMPENTPQAPRRRSKRWGTWLMVPLVAGLVLLVVFASEWRESLTVQRVVVEGSRVLSAGQVYAIASIPLKTPLYALDLLSVRQRVLAQPFIQSVSFHRQFPGVLRIRVTERTPIASLNNGQMRFVDPHGVLLPFVPSAVKLDLPMISGIDGIGKALPGDRLANSEVKTAIEVLQTAQEVDSSMFHFISEINMNNGKDIMLYSTDLGVPINLGRGEIAKKLLMLQSFWNGFAKTGSPEKLQSIDLRYEDQVVVRWQNEGKRPTKVAL